MFFLKCRQPNTREEIISNAPKCRPTTKVYVFSQMRPTPSLPKSRCLSKFHQRCPATRLLLSNATNAIPPQGYMFFWNATKASHQKCVSLNCRQRPNGIGVFFLKCCNAISPQGWGVNLKCRQHRPTTRVLVSNADNAVPPQGCKSLMQPMSPRHNSMCFFLKYLERPLAARVLVSNVTNAIPLKGYLFFFLKYYMPPVPSCHQGVSLKCHQCRPAPRIGVFLKCRQCCLAIRACGFS